MNLAPRFKEFVDAMWHVRVISEDQRNELHAEIDHLVREEMENIKPLPRKKWWQL